MTELDKLIIRLSTHIAQLESVYLEALKKNKELREELLKMKEGA